MDALVIVLYLAFCPGAGDAAAHHCYMDSMHTFTGSSENEEKLWASCSQAGRDLRDSDVISEQGDHPVAYVCILGGL